MCIDHERGGFINQLLDDAGALIWEHYHSDWTPGSEYNKEDPRHLFKPYDYLTGHFVEWAKLLLILRRYRPEDWHVESAERLFNTAMERAWDGEGQGVHYSFAPDGGILDTDRYYWVLSEMIAAAALLAL